MDSFTIMFWNVLSDELAMPMEGHVPFPHTDLAVLQWDVRKTRILDKIRAADPDVLCLVEVDHFEDWFVPELDKLGYQGRFHPKLRPKDDFKDGTACFWKESVFQYNGSFTIFYAPSDAQMALGIDLTPHGAKKASSLLVACTHLKAKPGFEERRLAQGKTLIAELNTMTGTGKALVVCGDFNDVPSSPVCTKFSASFTNSNPATEWTTWKKREAEVKRTIDYVWYKPDKLRCTSAAPIVPAEPGPYPSASQPSDHLPLVATFTYVS